MLSQIVLKQRNRQRSISRRIAAITPMTMPAIAPPLSPEEEDMEVKLRFPVAIAGRNPSVVVGLIDVVTVRSVELVTRNGAPAVLTVVVVVR